MAAEASENNTDIDNSNYWQCSRCTLNNIDTNTSCDACGGLNPEFSYDGATDDDIYEAQTLAQTSNPFHTEQQHDDAQYVKLDGYRIQGIYYKKQRAHRLQHNQTDGANALIALCNLLFLQQRMKWTKETKRVTLDELQEFLGDILPDLVLNNRCKNAMDETEQKHNIINKKKNKLSSIIEEYEDCGEIIKRLENNENNNGNIQIFNDLGIKLFDISENNENNNYEITVSNLCRLYLEINEGELSVLYRNGFYSTIVKHENILYEFVTNEEYINADPQITWRTMLTINGNEQNTNNRFGQTHVTNKMYYDYYYNENENENDTKNYKYKLPHIRIVSTELNKTLLTLNDEDMDELEYCLFNYSYIAGIKYGNVSYLMYLINEEDTILFDGYIKYLETSINMILPIDVRNLCFKYFLNDYIISDIISYFNHQHVNVCYPAVLTIHNIIKLDTCTDIHSIDSNESYATIKELIDRYDILNKFHNLICIDSGPNIKETVYNTILYIVSTGIVLAIDNIINDGLIITLIERLNDTSNYSSEYKQCIKILSEITCKADNECISYLIENGIIEALCEILKSDEEDDVWNTLDMLAKMVEKSNCDEEININQEKKNDIIKYINKCGGLLTMRDLALSAVEHIAIKCADFIEKYCDLDGMDTQNIEIILFKLGLGKYCLAFEEFGINYSLLNNLEAPIVECIIQNENHRKQFMFWLNKHQNKVNQLF